MIHSKRLAKFVYAFYPYEPSPFFEWYATKIFSNEEKALKFLKQAAENER